MKSSYFRIIVTAPDQTCKLFRTSRIYSPIKMIEALDHLILGFGGYKIEVLLVLAGAGEILLPESITKIRDEIEEGTVTIFVVKGDEGDDESTNEG